MTRREIIRRLDRDADEIVKTFYIKKTSLSLKSDGSTVSTKQFEKIKWLLENHHNEFGGITKHYFRLKRANNLTEDKGK